MKWILFLTPEGLSSRSVSRLENVPEITLSRNITRSARFLALNHANPYLADPVLHQALACIINPQTLVEELNEDVAPLPGFVLDDLWRSEEASLPCAGGSGRNSLRAGSRVVEGGRIYLE